MKQKTIHYIPNSTVNPLLADSFIYCLNKLTIIIKEKFNKRLKPFNIIGIHFGILFVLNKKKTLSQKELGLELGIDKASMVKFLDGLENEKYIKRTEDENDRRIKMVTVTPKGLTVLKKVDIIRQEVEAQFLSTQLSTKEQKLMRELTKKLILSANT